jgi:hypothetical protein
LNEEAEPYFLAIAALGHPYRYPLSSQRFGEIKLAWENLRHIVYIEEEWDAVIQNYLELEKTLLEAAARNMVLFEADWNSFQELRLRFAVRLSNLLSTCKAYLDHTPHHLNSLRPSEPDADAFATLASGEYDRRVGYQLMEALRGHAQHRGLPLHGATYDSRWVEEGEDGLLQYSVATHIDVETLRADRKFKKSVLAGLDDKRLQAEPYIRSYIEGLAAVHVGLRKHLEGKVEPWKATIRTAIADYLQASGEQDDLGLNAVKADEKGDWGERVPLVETMLQRIELLQRRNRSLVNLTRRFVTSAPKVAKKPPR